MSALRRVRALRARSEARPPPPLRPGRVLLVGGSSRGGTSIFTEVLRRSTPLVHLQGELHPLMRLHGDLGPPGPLGDGAPTPMDRGAFLADLAWECGQPLERVEDEAALWEFAVELAVRLVLQWPGLEIPLERVHLAAARALHGLAHAGAPWGELVDPGPFHVAFLADLRAEHPGIHPGLTDLDRGLVEATFGALPPPAPPERVIEEPPFVAIRPWRRVAPGTLVLKTPSLAYRLPWVQALFPEARLDLLHLRRGVAASVNGLWDGWRSPAFHAHHLPGRLAIAGYSEGRPGGDSWWKFDLPPGWQEMTRAPLQEVAAFQWRSAHRALLGWDAPGERRFDIHFSEFLARPLREQAALLRWLELEPGALAPLDALPLVMSTERPRARRWFDRAEQLSGVVADPRNLELMEALGFGRDPAAWD